MAEGKKTKKNKPTSKKYTKYKIEGDSIVREKSCPRCGPGIFLMKTYRSFFKRFLEDRTICFLMNFPNPYKTMCCVARNQPRQMVQN